MINGKLLDSKAEPMVYRETGAMDGTSALFPDVKREAEWAAWRGAQRKGIPAGSSLEAFIGTESHTKITEQVRRPQTRDEEIVSHDFEYERMLNQGKSEMTNGRPKQALIGPRKCEENETHTVNRWTR